MDKFDSIINTILSMTAIIKAKPVRSIITLSVVFTIVLVKPLLYYSTLYLKIYEFLLYFLFILFIIGLISFIIKKKKDEYFDNNTIAILIICPIMLSIENIVYKIQYDIIIKSIYHNDINVFINNVHEMIYDKDFYQYIFSNFITLLMLSIEFLNLLSVTYFCFYILYIFLKNLSSEKSTIVDGFTYHETKNLIKIFIFSFCTSPCYYENFMVLWNKIF